MKIFLGERLWNRKAINIEKENSQLGYYKGGSPFIPTFIKKIKRQRRAHLPIGLLSRKIHLAWFSHMAGCPSPVLRASLVWVLSQPIIVLYCSVVWLVFCCCC